MIRDYGYEPYHAFREGKRGGGVAVLYKKQLAVKEEGASTSEFSSLEYAWVTVSLQLRRKMVLACIYRKQEVSFSLFIDELSSLLDKIIFKGDAALIVGDFNAWVDIEDDVNANSLLTLMSAFGLSQQVQEPTHRNGHTLDQIYVNECQALIQHEVMNDTLGLTTDHMPIMVDLHSCNTQQKTRTIHYRKLKNVDMVAFRNDLKVAYESMQFAENENFETLATQYHNLSSSVVNQHAPLAVMKSQSSKPPWIDLEYKQNRTLRRKFERRWKQNRTEDN